jgi:large conductance mechanosensitive channel
MQPPQFRRPTWLAEFQAFVMRGNVVDLAVGIIIGAAFTSIVSSLVKDLLTPILGLLLGGVDFSNVYLTLKGPHTATLDAAKAAGAVTLNVGLFLNAVINFLIIAFAVFWLVRVLSLLYRPKTADTEIVPPTRDQELLTEIRDLLAARALPQPNP